LEHKQPAWPLIREKPSQIKEKTHVEGAKSQHNALTAKVSALGQDLHPSSTLLNACHLKVFYELKVDS
jgi:hypothetical protein